MPKHKRTQVDIVELSTLIRNSFIGIGVILVLACHNLTMGGVSLSISLSGYIYSNIKGLPTVIKVQNFDKNSTISPKPIYTLLAGAFLFSIGIFVYGYASPKVQVSKHTLTFSDMYGVGINISEIDAITFLHEIPNLKRRVNGFSSGSIKKGTLLT